LKRGEYSFTEKILKIAVISVSVTAIVELALSQFSIKITRLSAVEITGISLFAFIILGLVTTFTVTRMKENAGGKIFAIIMNFITAAAAVWYLRLLLTDDVLIKNLYYVLDRRTQVYELLPLKERITVSIPLAVIILGAVVYFLGGLTILITSFINSLSVKKSQTGNINE
jgi:uncharacterized membrane protein YGL010W